MRHSLVIFSSVICLLIHGIQLAQPREEIVQNADPHCTSDTDTLVCNHTDDDVHNRQRRYLLFEKGAALSITAAAVKTIISAIPRGLNLICEETIYYDLPSSTSIPKIVSTPPTKPPPPPSTKVEMRRKLMQNSFPVSAGYTPYYMYKYRRSVHPPDNNTDGNSMDIEAILLQQLEKFAEIYGYNGGHCIMRTICEAQHFLYPRGQSLFHDIIRIILEFSLPTIRNNKKYFTASRIVNPMDCANLYGPHCRISFLDYFTVQIHGKFM